MQPLGLPGSPASIVAPMVLWLAVNGNALMFCASAKLSLPDTVVVPSVSPSRSAGCRPEGPPGATENVGSSGPGGGVGVDVGPWVDVARGVKGARGVTVDVGPQTSGAQGVFVGAGVFAAPSVMLTLTTQTPAG